MKGGSSAGRRAKTMRSAAPSRTSGYLRVFMLGPFMLLRDGVYLEVTRYDQGALPCYQRRRGGLPT